MTRNVCIFGSETYNSSQYFVLGELYRPENQKLKKNPYIFNNFKPINFHSVETALVRVQNDLLQSLDAGNEAILILLDLTSAFDTVDHNTLQSRLVNHFGVSGTAAKWFASYLSGRKQQVIVDGTKSDPTLLQWGVPQGSVIGPILFICYTAPIQDIIHAHNLSSMMYADDTQLYISVKSGDENCIIPKIETCLQEIRLWMQDNFLFLNDSKMEILHLSSHLRHVKELSPITVNGIKSYSSKAVRNLGVVMDNHLSMRNQVNTMCSKASFALRRISKVRRFLSRSSTEILVHAFISSILDNCNSLLIGIQDKDIAKLQRIQNFAARFVSLCKKVWAHYTYLKRPALASNKISHCIQNSLVNLQMSLWSISTISTRSCYSICSC